MKHSHTVRPKMERNLDRGSLQRKSRLVLQHALLGTFQLTFIVNRCRLIAKHWLFPVTVTEWWCPRHSERQKDEFTSWQILLNTYLLWSHMNRFGVTKIAGHVVLELQRWCPHRGAAALPGSTASPCCHLLLGYLYAWPTQLWSLGTSQPPSHCFYICSQ